MAVCPVCKVEKGTNGGVCSSCKEDTGKSREDALKEQQERIAKELEERRKKGLS